MDEINLSPLQFLMTESIAEYPFSVDLFSTGIGTGVSNSWD
jgi:hypothetical protein